MGILRAVKGFAIGLLLGALAISLVVGFSMYGNQVDDTIADLGSKVGLDENSNSKQETATRTPRPPRLYPRPGSAAGSSGSSSATRTPSLWEAGRDATPVPPPGPPPKDPDDPGHQTFRATGTEFDTQEIEMLIHQKVFEIRLEHDRRAIRYDVTLASVARAHSADMADRDYVAHENPDGEGSFDRYSDVDSNCSRYGENIHARTHHRNFNSNEEIAEATVNGWMNSPPHRENLLYGGFSHHGIGVQYRETGRHDWYATQNLCWAKDLDLPTVERDSG